MRSRASAKWQASEDFAETMPQLRRAIQIPSAAHSALEYQRWAVRSQFRAEGRRFMKLMKHPLQIPLLHLRGDDDPYVLADPVERTRRYAPLGTFVGIPGAGVLESLTDIFGEDEFGANLLPHTLLLQ